MITGYKAKLFRAYSKIMQMDEMDSNMEKMLNLAMQQRLEMMSEIEAKELYVQIKTIFVEEEKKTVEVVNPLL